MSDRGSSAPSCGGIGGIGPAAIKITDISLTPVSLPYKVPYHWAQGVKETASLILVRVKTDSGLEGIGESAAAQGATAILDIMGQARNLMIGQSPFDNARLISQAYQIIFASQGTGSAPRFGYQALAGIEMALWDLAGKVCGRAVHELLGGALHDAVSYFGFVQGDRPEELAAHARQLSDEGCAVIYAKVGRGEQLDLAIVEAIRGAIGPNKRLRVDANEAWDPLSAGRMIKKLMAFDIEFIEQPTPSASLSALKQIKASSPIPIAADQLVFTPEDAYEVCRNRAADVIVLGLHETGGITRFRKAAAIAEAAGIKICLHGIFESGITTAASLAACLSIPNLDDGNQYMNHLIREDLVAAPDLSLKNGKLMPLLGPGFGITLDEDAVARAAEDFTRRKAQGRAL